jgi:hypothetical protein
MDAVRLISATRHALAQARAAQDIVTEAWQAQGLAQAVGSHLAINGPPEMRAEAHGLSEAGGGACGAPDPSVLRTGGIRAAQMSGVRDPRGVLLGLGRLLGEVGTALVGVACAADDESLYWQCIEAIDAADESGDRVRELLRHLAGPEQWPTDTLPSVPPDTASEVVPGAVSEAEPQALPEAGAADTVPDAESGTVPGSAVEPI